MPFGRDTRVVPSNIVLDKGPGPPMRRGDLGSEPPVHSDAACRQITLALFMSVIPKTNCCSAHSASMSKPLQLYFIVCGNCGHGNHGVRSGYATACMQSDMR